MSDDNNIVEQFDEWFANEKAKGLSDIKFALAFDASKGGVARVVMKEILSAEKLIAADISDDLLEPTEFPPSHVGDIAQRVLA